MVMIDLLPRVVIWDK